MQEGGDARLISHKRDVQGASRLWSIDREIDLEEVRSLLRWTKDVNWPVANEVGVFVARMGGRAVDEIEAILNGTDAGWKYACIQLVVARMSAVDLEPLRSCLNRLATAPNDAERMEEVDVAARDVLRRLGGL